MNHPNDIEQDSEWEPWVPEEYPEFNSGFGNGWELNHEYNPEDPLCDW